MTENIVSAIHGLIAAVESTKTDEESSTIAGLRHLLQGKEDELACALQEKDSLLEQAEELHNALGAQCAELQAVVAERDGLLSDREAVIREKQDAEQQVAMLLEQLQKVQEDLELYVSLNHQQHEMLEDSLDFQARALQMQFQVICVDGQKLLSPAEP